MDKNNSDNITENIKIKFTKIKQTRNRIKDKFVNIQKVQNDIKDNYVNYVKKEQDDFFGLDSFHFQNKVLTLEFNNMMKLYQFIDNRIYGDYYKLFTQIELFLKKHLKTKQYEKIKELKNIDKYPTYKDLEVYKTYDFDTINNIHQDIIVIIACVKDVYKDNEKFIKDDMKKLNLGLNIDNYIINSQYKNMVLLTTNNKFENYLQVYHKYHFELLYKFHEKISLCYQHINHSPSDERFLSESSEDNSSTSGDMEQDLLNDQFNETPANRNKRRTSVDIFFSEKSPIIEEKNEVIENGPLLSEIVESIEKNEEFNYDDLSEEQNEEEQLEQENITLDEDMNNDILETVEESQQEVQEQQDDGRQEAQEEAQEEEFVSVASNKKKRRKRNKNKNN